MIYLFLESAFSLIEAALKREGLRKNKYKNPSIAKKGEGVLTNAECTECFL